jgi:sigma-B regulation protein RsbU (phosphoserine phosphatase)
MAIHLTDLHAVRDQLQLRREKLGAAIARSQTANLVQLLEQVDKALERVDNGAYGICEHCLGKVEDERLLADPLAQLCLDCLNPSEQRALEQDLALAARMQAGLLPAQDSAAAGWKASYHYEPARLVSGDYCDLVPFGKDLYFMVGDVSGKGVAASMLMANLHAMFRALIPNGECGEVEICNGGHILPLHLSRTGINHIQGSALPVGMFHDQEFVSTQIGFSPGDSLVIYTDGLTESLGAGGVEYGDHRLGRLLENRHGHGSRQLVDTCVQDLSAFRGAAPSVDDQTLMVLQFSPIQN